MDATIASLGAKGISDQYDIAIWLDRASIPHSRSSWRRDGAVNAGIGLDRLARQCGARGGLVENVYLIAASEYFARIQRAAVVLHGRLSAATKGSTASRQLQWEDITSSNELLARMGQEWMFRFMVHYPMTCFTAAICRPARWRRNSAYSWEALIVRPRYGPITATAPSPPHRPTGRWSWNWFPWAADALAGCLPNRRAGGNRALPRERYGADQLQNLPNSRCLVHGETNLHWEVLAIGLASSASGLEANAAQR